MNLAGLFISTCKARASSGRFAETRTHIFWPRLAREMRFALVEAARAQKLGILGCDLQMVGFTEILKSDSGDNAMKYFTLLTCFLLVGILAGCTPQEPLTSTTTGPEDSASEEKQSDEGGNVTGDDVRRKVGEATEAVEEFSRQQMQEAFQNSQRSLEQINEKIALLKKDMGQLEEAAQVQFQESINKLDSTFENAQQRLSQLRDTGTEAWTRAQDDLQQAMDDLEEAYRQVAETFEKAKSSESEGESTDGS